MTLTMTRTSDQQTKLLVYVCIRQYFVVQKFFKNWMIRLFRSTCELEKRLLGCLSDTWYSLNHSFSHLHW